MMRFVLFVLLVGCVFFHCSPARAQLEGDNAFITTQLANADVIAPLNDRGSGPDPGGGLISIFLGEKQSIFSQLFSDIDGFDNPIFQLALVQLETVFGEIPKHIQDLIKRHLARLDFSDLTFSEAAEVLGKIVLQGLLIDEVYSGLEDITCPGLPGEDGEVLGGTQIVYAQTIFTQKVSRIDIDDFIGSSLDVLILGQETREEICEIASRPPPTARIPPGPGQPGNDPFETAGSEDSTQTSQQAPPGTVLAPPGSLKNGDWTCKSAEHIRRRWTKRGGMCGKGTRLAIADSSKGLKMKLNTACCMPRNGEDFKRILNTSHNSNWSFMPHIKRPQDAPNGCINTYSDNVTAGYPAPPKGDKTGKRYGHVEVMSIGCGGDVKTVSFTITRMGGTVLRNYTGTFCCTGSGCTPRVR